jgi:hypothetical protein
MGELTLAREETQSVRLRGRKDDGREKVDDM